MCCLKLVCNPRPLQYWEIILDLSSERREQVGRRSDKKEIQYLREYTFGLTDKRKWQATCMNGRTVKMTQREAVYVGEIFLALKNALILKDNNCGDEEAYELKLLGRGNLSRRGEYARMRPGTGEPCHSATLWMTIAMVCMG